jgi:hypothetical protein
VTGRSALSAITKSKNASCKRYATDDLDSSGTTTICIDEATGALLRLATRIPGEQNDDLTARAFEPSLPADFAPPSTPTDAKPIGKNILPPLPGD